MKKWQLAGLVVMSAISEIVIIYMIFSTPRKNEDRSDGILRSRTSQKCQNVFGFTPSDPITAEQRQEILSRLSSSRAKVYDLAQKEGVSVGSQGLIQSKNISFLLRFNEIVYKVELETAIQTFRFFADDADVLIASIESVAEPIA